MSIHPTALVHRQAVVPASAKVGPYCSIGAGVVLGEDCELISHVVLEGHTRIGARNRIFPFVCLGFEPQVLKYEEADARVEIGSDNILRENVTISRGIAGKGVTRVGDYCLLMAYVHIGHDSQVGSHCILPNGAALGGHVIVEDFASASALGPVHQSCRIGTYAYIGGGTTITQDVLPYSLTSVRRDTHACGLNRAGLEQLGFRHEHLSPLEEAYRILLHPKLNTSQVLERLKADVKTSNEVTHLIEFIEASERGVIR